MLLTTLCLTDRETDGQTLAFLELLTEPKIKSIYRCQTPTVLVMLWTVCVTASGTFLDSSQCSFFFKDTSVTAQGKEMALVF